MMCILYKLDVTVTFYPIPASEAGHYGEKNHRNMWMFIINLHYLRSTAPSRSLLTYTVKKTYNSIVEVIKKKKNKKAPFFWFTDLLKDVYFKFKFYE